MIALAKGQYVARVASGKEDLIAAQRLRQVAFLGESDALDRDEFDNKCTHILIEEIASTKLVCCFRLLPFAGGAEIDQSYSAQFYDLSGLRTFEGPMVEMGRFCIHPDHSDPDILRVAWGAMTTYVDQNDVEILFGCSSFSGIKVAQYLDTFAVLRDHHLAPEHWLPKVKSPNVVHFPSRLGRKPDLKNAQMRMPPLLRTYLLMGGWVSDHAVVDPHMNTLHVFTGVEIKAIPPARKRLLRAIGA